MELKSTSISNFADTYNFINSNINSYEFESQPVHVAQSFQETQPSCKILTKRKSTELENSTLEPPSAKSLNHNELLTKFELGDFMSYLNYVDTYKNNNTYNFTIVYDEFYNI